MISKKSKVTLILMALFALLACDAFAWDLSTRAAVALGSGKLSVPSGVTAQAANNSSTNTSFMNNTSMNSSATGFTSINISAVSATSINLSSNASMNSSIADSTIATLSDSKNKLIEPVHKVPIMDLSRYAKDRLNKKLGGYRNIIYPMAESSGFSATTSSGSGGGCGC